MLAPKVDQAKKTFNVYVYWYNGLITLLQIVKDSFEVIELFHCHVVWDSDSLTP